MRAIETPGANVRLVLEIKDEKGEKVDERTLPATRIKAFDEDLGETESDARPAIATAWLPDEGERKALANGALIELVVFGPSQPPLSIKVGEPLSDDPQRLVRADVVDRAVGIHLAILSKRLARGEGLPEPGEVLELWTKALEVAAGSPDEILDLIDEAEAEIEKSAEELEETSLRDEIDGARARLDDPNLDADQRESLAAELERLEAMLDAAPDPEAGS